MAVTKFKDTTYSLSGLLERIGHGEIGLPDIQRPFVWKAARVRDLFDSMYRGFPVGYLLFWATGAESGAKMIGTGSKQAAPQLLIVDGQQRLTSLYTVINAAPIIRNDYSEGRIRIAFRPEDSSFEVTDAAIERDAEWIPDISEVFRGSFHSFTRNFLEQLRAHREDELSDSDENRLAEALDRLKDLQNYPFKAIELDPSVDEEQVADIFVRINSEGVQLNQADFILTLMSVFWEDGRADLEEFCRAGKKPSTDGPGPFTHFLQPSPDQLLRVAVALAFRRGRLQHVYSILRGKDLETGEVSPQRRDHQFERLQEAQQTTLDLTNWHEFLKCLTNAGFRSKRMISSEIAVLYTYAMWLIGRCDYGVDLKTLRDTISRWFFMAHTTGRYSNSPETQLESDLARLRAINKDDAATFCRALDEIVHDTFTPDYWHISLPNRLDRSSAKSPPLSAYWSALVLLDAQLLFSEIKVSTMLDPAVTPVRNIERHHLFPKAHLASLGLTDTKAVNTIANMAFVDWADNAEISSTAPNKYWAEMAAGLEPAIIDRQRYWHALPIGWEQLYYDDFCEKRRRLIAEVVRDIFGTLCSDSSPSPQPDDSVATIIETGESNVIEFKAAARWNQHAKQRDPRIEHAILKTVAGFMNAEGGTLLIGVADDGSVVGLDSDYSTLKKENADGFELFLTDLVNTNVSGPAASLVRARFPKVHGTEICQMRVSPAGRPVFAKPIGGGSEFSDFWVRTGNQTRRLVGTEMMEYQGDHWG